MRRRLFSPPSRTRLATRRSTLTTRSRWCTWRSTASRARCAPPAATAAQFAARRLALRRLFFAVPPTAGDPAAARAVRAPQQRVPPARRGRAGAPRRLRAPRARPCLGDAPLFRLLSRCAAAPGRAPTRRRLSCSCRRRATSSADFDEQRRAQATSARASRLLCVSAAGAGGRRAAPRGAGAQGAAGRGAARPVGRRASPRQRHATSRATHRARARQRRAAPPARRALQRRGAGRPRGAQREAC